MKEVVSMERKKCHCTAGGLGEAEVGASECGRNGEKSRDLLTAGTTLFWINNFSKMGNARPFCFWFRSRTLKRQGERGLLKLLWSLILMKTDVSNNRCSA